MNLKKSNVLIFAVILSILLFFEAFAQQPLPFIRVSPQATVSQNISFANFEINYSRPGVNGREIWGKLVPYGLAPNAFGNGKPMPWRAGANENTTISLSHDAMIGGKPVKAGTYSIHIVVQEDEWTFSLNSETQAWGSFFYEKEKDVTTYKSKPQKAPFQEWMAFGFENLTPNSAEAYLHWGDVKVPFKIEIDQHKVVLDTYRTQLTTLPGFNQAAWGTAARYCLNNNINLDEAMTWIDKALSMNGGNNFANNSVKADLLIAKGNKAEGEKLLAESMGTATEAELNVYGYQLMGQNKIDEALKIFKMNIDRHPDSWNTYDSYGEAANNKGEKSTAKEYYEKAYNMAPGAQKPRIEGILKGLE